MTLLNMSFYGAVIILAILIIRAFTLHKLPKKTFLILWAVALVRLLVPFEIASDLSLYSLLPEAFIVGEQNDVSAPNTENPQKDFENYYNSLEHKHQVSSGRDDPIIVGENGGPVYLPTDPANGEIIPLPDVDEEVLPTIDNTAPKEPDFSIPIQELWNNLRPHLPLFWGIGALLCAGFFLVSYLRCRLEFSTSLPVTEDYAAEWLKQHPLKRTITIRRSDKISAPLTYGIFRPVILMPKKTDWSNQPQLDYVLYHEFTHIRRFDLLAKLVTIAAVCLHWFNPFVWLLYFFFNRDLELSCDNCVVKHFSEAKSAYANTLIGMEEKKNFSSPLCNHFSKNAIEERITAIMKSKKTTTGMMVAAIVIVILVVVTLTTGQKAQTTDTGATPPPAPTTEPTATPSPAAESTPAPGSLVWYPATNLFYDNDTFRCSTTDVSPELGYTFIIEKLMISLERTWSNLSIDLEPYAEGKTWSCMGAFYDADTDCAYLEFVPFPSTDEETTNAGILHVTIPFDSSTDYTVTPLGSGTKLEDDALWFSEIRKIKNRIYFNCGSCNGALWAIDLATNELLDLSYVNEKMQEIANTLCANFGWGHDPDIWFSSSRQEEETVVYSASVCKEMDTGTIFSLQLYYDGDTFRHHTVTYQDSSGKNYTTTELVSQLIDLYDTYRSMYSLLFHSGLECGMHTHLPIEEVTINNAGPYYKVLVKQFPTLQSVIDYMETICMPHFAKELRREYLHMDSDEPWLAELNGQLYTQYYSSSTWDEPVNFRFLNLSFYDENTVALDYQGYENTPINIRKQGTIIYTHTEKGWRISSTTSNYDNPYFDAFEQGKELQVIRCTNPDFGSPDICNDIVFYFANKEDTLESALSTLVDALPVPMTLSSEHPYHQIGIVSWRVPLLTLDGKQSADYILLESNGVYRLQREEAANAMLEGKLTYDTDGVYNEVKGS